MLRLHILLSACFVIATALSIVTGEDVVVEGETFDEETLRSLEDAEVLLEDAENFFSDSEVPESVKVNTVIAVTKHSIVYLLSSNEAAQNFFA